MHNEPIGSPPAASRTVAGDEPTGIVEVLIVDQVPPVEVAPGIIRRSLTRTDHAGGWLIDFAPGTQWPATDHHDGEERYFVLSGEILEGDRVHGPGAYVVFASGSSHRPRSESGARMLGISIVTT
jgi:hypothetical protein